MKNLGLIFLFIALEFSMLSQSYKIDVTMKNLPNQELILGHYLAGQLYPDDTLKLNNKGKGTFKGEKLPGGMYFIFLPAHTRFDFFLDDDQTFAVEADTFDFLKTVKFTGSAENTAAQNYQRFMFQKNEEIRKLIKEKDKYASEKKKKKVKATEEKIKQIGDELDAEFEKTVSQYPNLFFTKFLKAVRPPALAPESVKDEKEKYFYFKKHYFDNFDIADPRLLRTPVYQKTIDKYLDEVVIPEPDTLNETIDMLVAKSREKNNNELARFMLVHLHNKYASSQVMSHENVYVYLADKYYINKKYNTWSDSKFIEELKKKNARRRGCLIGVKAHEIELLKLPTDTVSINAFLAQSNAMREIGLKIEKSDADSIVKNNLKVQELQKFTSGFKKGKLFSGKAKYTILWFWSPDCSHCRKDTPKFLDAYKEKKMKKKGVEVYAIFMNKNIDDWEAFIKNNNRWLEFVKEHKMNEVWKNSWNPYDPYKRNYDINSTPVLYVLDKDKKIIAKRIGYEQALEVIEKMESDKKKKN